MGVGGLGSWGGYRTDEVTRMLCEILRLGYTAWHPYSFAQTVNNGNSKVCGWCRSLHVVWPQGALRLTH